MSLSNALVPGLIGGAATFSLAYLVGRAKPVAPDDQGWNVLRSGWLLNCLFASCLIIILLLVFVLANITSRSDWREQIIPLVSIILGFAVSAIYLFYVCYSRTVKWNDDIIVITRRFGGTTVHPLKTVQLTTNPFTSEHIITFQSGKKVRVPTMMKGADQLAHRIQNRGFG